MAVSIPSRTCRALVATPLQRRRDFLLQQLFDEPPNLLANPGFERIEPIRSQKWHFGLSPCMLCHGVISAGGAHRRFLGFGTQEITPPPIFHHPPGTTAAGPTAVPFTEDNQWPGSPGLPGIDLGTNKEPGNRLEMRLLSNSP
jgi:hypothetical protein